MRISLFATALTLGLVTLAAAPASAEPLATDAQRILRPGDKIEWTVSGPHFLKVGSVGLSPLADVDKIITFSPALTATGTEGSGAAGGTVTGTVKDDAATQGVATFVFTCGAHAAAMKSLPFTIAPRDSQPPRILKIRATPQFHWILAGEDAQIDTN